MMCFRFGDEIVGFELRLDCLTFHSKAMAPDSGLFHIQQRLCWLRGSTTIATLYSSIV